MADHLPPDPLAKALEAHASAIVDTLAHAGRPDAKVVVIWFEGLSRSLISANLDKSELVMALALAIAHVVSGSVQAPYQQALEEFKGTVN